MTVLQTLNFSLARLRENFEVLKEWVGEKGRQVLRWEVRDQHGDEVLRQSEVIEETVAADSLD